MLLQFTIENYRSFKEPQTLSMGATGLRGPDGVVPIERWGHGALRVAAVYGANASGKTSLLRGLAFVRQAVLGSQSGWKPEQGVPRRHFELDPAYHDRPSRFVVEFIVGDTQFEYGFSADSTRITEEWLYAYPGARRRVWFQRHGDRFTFGKNLSGENKVIERVTRQNSLFLSAAAQNNHEQLTPIYSWFSSHLIYQSASRAVSPSTLSMCGGEKYGVRIARMLKSADLGLMGVDVSEQEQNESAKRIFDAVQAAIAREFGELPPSKFPEKNTRVTFRHRSAEGRHVPFEIDDESQGTRAFLSLLGPVVEALEEGQTLCIDELDSSLHPLLALEIVRAFNDSKLNPKNAQLIFNTHDTNLLDPAVLRRDQIWFVEKDDNGGSHLYPLTQFKPRKNENLQRGYLQGRYGAVPFLGADSLLEATEEDAE